MFTNTKSERPRRRLRIASASATTLLAATVLAGALATADPRPAGAWQYALPSGRPGAVTQAPAVNVGKLSQGMLGLQLTLYGSTGPTVSRSAATTGAQDVNIMYSVQRWNGSAWAQIAAQHGNVRIPAGVASGREPALYVVPTAGARSYYRVVMHFSWFVAGTNTLLGSTFVAPDRTSDFVCQYLPCAATAGYVWAG
jgi:hypothetical protein